MSYIVDNLNNILNSELQVKYVTYGIVAYYCCKILISTGRWLKKQIGNSTLMKTAKNYKNQIDKQHDEQLKQIPDYQGKLKVEQVILQDVKGLKELLDRGDITSEELLNIYARRALSKGRELSAITESNYKNAQIIARNCDEIRLDKSKKQFILGKELFGIPISIKETFDMKGFPSTVGVINRINNQFDQNGLVIQILLESGAIPFVRSNVPQVLMTIESTNHIYGRTLNPWDLQRASGGSSGGEGSLIASGCSPLGIGSDIGGSIRTPAIFCGISGFKPTAGRVSFQGHTNYSPTFTGQIAVPATLGPLGKTVDDCILMTKALLNPNHLKNINPLLLDYNFQIHPFKDQDLNRKGKLKIGYFTSIPFCPTARCMARGVEMSVEAMRQHGHQCEVIVIPNAEEIILSFFSLVTADGLQAFQDTLGDENYIKEYQLLALPFSLDPVLNSVMKIVMGLAMPRAQKIVEHTKALSAVELLCLIDRILQFRDKFAVFMVENQLDAIIAPAFATPAILHTNANQVAISSMYTFIWNVLNLPAGTIPVTRVSEGQEVYVDQLHQDLVTKVLQNTMKDTLGLPVGIQVVTRANQDEKCLSILKELETYIGYKQQLPFN